MADALGRTIEQRGLRAEPPARARGPDPRAESHCPAPGGRGFTRTACRRGRLAVPSRGRRPCPVAGCPELLEIGTRGTCALHAARRRPCRVPGCPGWAEHRGYCSDHADAERAAFDAARGSAGARGYGAHWRKIRARFLRRHRTCVECGAPATEVDHIRPRAEGGDDSDANLRALCKPHHSRRTLRDSVGRGRGAGRTARAGGA